LRNASPTRRYTTLPWPLTVRRGFAERIGIYSRTGHLNCRGALDEYQLKTRGNSDSLTPRPDGSVWFLAGSELDELTPTRQIVSAGQRPEKHRVSSGV
jgi:hypothetical protein